MAGRWERPPWWAVGVMVVGAVALAAGLGYAAQHEPTHPVSRSEADPSGAPPVRILVVGDSYTSGSRIGGNGPAGWAELLDEQLDTPDRTVDIDEAAAGGSGYVHPGVKGTTFWQLAEGAGGPYDVVVFFGSRNDVAPAADVEAGAETAFATARQAFPDARLLVIGPPWVDGRPPSYILLDRDAVSAAATTAGATFVDPIAEHWFVDDPDLIGSDGVHPTDDGHRYLADRIAPALQAEVAEVR